MSSEDIEDRLMDATEEGKMDEANESPKERVVTREQLKRWNYAAMVLHMGLLVALILNKVLRKPTKTSVTLLKSTFHPKVEELECECRPVVGLKTTESTLSVFGMVITFTAITIAAHFVYAGEALGYADFVFVKGKNPLRWIEYGASAAVMCVILAVLAGIRDRNLIIVLFLASFALMQQGYSIEAAIARDSPKIDRLVPLFTGWILLAATWYPIFDSWYSVLDDAKDQYNKCKHINDVGEPPDWLEPLIIVVFLLFSSFGFVAVIHVVHSLTAPPAIVQAAFPLYEFAYIFLSFASKATLVIWCIAAVFNGSGLEYLKNDASADHDECKGY